MLGDRWSHGTCSEAATCLTSFLASAAAGTGARGSAPSCMMMRKTAFPPAKLLRDYSHRSASGSHYSFDHIVSPKSGERRSGIMHASLARLRAGGSWSASSICPHAVARSARHQCIMYGLKQSNNDVISARYEPRREDSCFFLTLKTDMMARNSVS
ncbi:uncharacterized protein K489DRAFT_33015 [Dissoconium aciculare CBS 342.82]|uniref:Uncharacterized protein n=1 Tax=Dissoconium aciculare CBS 342.82 TaxID=1314786 RepID=A0A6J3LYT3_9PEZI|nr:uncharacterized protein K489DRAFT_33015 [Dissoconium aciculare CBS 342.82]KAF1820454.1 hypothetical protein K489DRAFT_33015 [Dissoconium aciculare CBS 342.82]